MERKAGPPPTYEAQGQYGQPPNYGRIQTNPTVMTATPQYYVVTAPPPEDYLVRSVMATIFCFWPVGIAAIVRSCESRSAYTSGNTNLATTCSESARVLSNVAIGIGTVCHVVWIIVVVVYMVVIAAAVSRHI